MWISEPTPVTTSSMTAVSRSTAKSKPMLNAPDLDPGEVVFDVGCRRSVAEHAEAERTFSTQRNDSKHRADRDRVDDGSWETAAEQAVDQEAGERE